MCVCACVCMYMYIYTSMYTYTYIYMYLYTHRLTLNPKRALTFPSPSVYAVWKDAGPALALWLLVELVLVAGS